METKHAIDGNVDSDALRKEPLDANAAAKNVKRKQKYNTMICSQCGVEKET